MPVFLKDSDKLYTYQDLLYCINTSLTYKPYFKSPCLFEFFCNLIIGLVSNSSIVLLDSDLNDGEFSEIDPKAINVPVKVDKPVFQNIKEVVHAVQISTSGIVIFTSGTTGQPKRVKHSIQTLTRAVRVSDHYWGQIWGFAYNPTHMAGLQVFFQAFENLNAIVNIFNYSRDIVYREIRQEKISHISATPTFYRLLLPVEEIFEQVRRVTLGGEKSDTKLHSSIQLLFPNAKINNIYASTEAGSLFAANGENFQIPLSLQGKFKVENDELLIHKSLLGESESFSYSGDFYRTGDIIEWVDKELGLFRFKNRKNELINVGGYKVNPGEVEEVLLQIDEIQQVIVCGRANSVLGNVLCAEIKIMPGKQLDETSIRQYLKDKLQDFKIPRRIKFVEEFSLTRTGKLKRV